MKLSITTSDNSIEEEEEDIGVCGTLLASNGNLPYWKPTTPPKSFSQQVWG